MADKGREAIEAQSNKYIEDMNALQSSLEKQPGILGRIFASIGQFFSGFLPQMGKAITGAIPSIWTTFSDTVKAAYAFMHTSNVAWLDKLVAKVNMSSEMREYLAKMLSDSSAAESMLMPIIDVFLLLSLFKGFLQVFVEDTDQGTRMRLRNALPDPSTAIRAMFLDPSKEKAVREILQRYGLNDERSDMTINAARALLDTGTIQSLYWRGEIDLEGVKTRMRALGYTDARTEEILKTWNVIPGPQDIISMAVREAFSPEQVVSLGLDEAFPPEVAEWAAKVGLKDPWPKMYWRAHWTLPSAQMGFEMLHRGQITESDLRGLLKALDYSPVWHERLMNIAYNVITRVDARRLYSTGVWSEEDLHDGYIKMGYSPRDAEALTTWTVQEYSSGDKELSRAQIEKAYTTNIIARPEAKLLLRTLGYSELRTEWLLDMADFSSASAERSEAIQATKDMYLAGLSTPTEVRQRLAKEEVDASRVESLLERWDATLATKRKLPSKTDLDKFLKAGLIEEREYKSELTRLGYSSEMAERYYKLNAKTAEE